MGSTHDGRSPLLRDRCFDEFYARSPSRDRADARPFNRAETNETGGKPDNMIESPATAVALGGSEIAGDFMQDCVCYSEVYWWAPGMVHRVWCFKLQAFFLCMTESTARLAEISENVALFSTVLYLRRNRNGF